MERKRRSCWLYVLHCADGTFYAGISGNVKRRLRQHRGELVGGAKYTSSRRPVHLLVSWRYSSRSYALHKESEFKKLSKAEKNKFVKKPQLWGKHPRKWEKSV